jgi:lipopolysaccharide biosynthesis glycosyltransferase
MTDPINIVFAADANYAMPLAVALTSVAANCDKSRTLHFYVLQWKISDVLREKVQKSLDRQEFPNARIEWLDAPIDRIGNFKLAHNYTTPLTFARLVLTDLLPQEVRKVIYLDCDLVVDDDIAELWDTDIGDVAIAAVRDTAGNVSEPDGILNYRELGIPADAHYFNAGVLVMNLERWRGGNLAERVLGYLSTYHDIIQMADQEALNAVLWDDWKELEYRWNWQILHRDYRTGRQKIRWSPETARKSIIHFTSGEKPWLPACGYGEKERFNFYLDRTFWAGLRVPWRKEIAGRAKLALGDLRAAIYAIAR